MIGDLQCCCYQMSVGRDQTFLASTKAMMAVTTAMADDV